MQVIRALFDGGNVNHRGAHYRVENAQLFTRPTVPPPILLAVGPAQVPGAESAPPRGETSRLAGASGPPLYVVQRALLI